MVCTFFYAPTKQCTCSYCYYPRSDVDCPIKKAYLEEVGVIYRESPDTQSVTAQMSQRKYPKQY